MSDIQPGDVVVCVDAKPRHYTSFPENMMIREGRHYRVSAVGIGGGSGRKALRLCEFGGCATCFTADRFRKLNDEPDDAALIARIKGCQPRIPELPLVTTKPVKLDPELWPDLQTQLGKDGA